MLCTVLLGCLGLAPLEEWRAGPSREKNSMSFLRVGKVRSIGPEKMKTAHVILEDYGQGLGQGHVADVKRPRAT